MTKTQKALIAAGAVTAGLFLIFRRGSSSYLPASKIYANVMQYSGDFWREGIVYSVDPALMAAIAAVESGGNPSAVGAAGEIGMMQIMPGTWRQYCEGLVTQNKDLFIPAIAIRCATSIISRYYMQYGVNAAVVAAYNCGTGNVKPDGYKYRVPKTTYRYVEKVLGYTEGFRRLFKGMYPKYDELFPTQLWAFYLADLTSGLSGLGGVVKPMRIIQRVPVRMGQIAPRPLYLRGPRLGLRYNQARYEAGFDPPGACPVAPRGLGLRRGTRWLYR